MKKLILFLAMLMWCSGAWADITTGLVAYYTLDDATGINPVDSSGNGYTATQHNSPTSVIGKINNGLLFNGTSQYLTVAYNSTISPTTTVTESFWFKTTTANATAVVDFARHDGQFTPLQLDSQCSGQGNYVWWTAGGLQHACFTWKSTYYDGNWHLYVATYDSVAGGNAYIDNVNILTFNTNLGALTLNTGNLAFAGTNSGGEYLPATLDEIRIYNRVLSLSDLTQLYNYGLSHFDLIQGNSIIRGGSIIN